jgi:hypothetical protein
MTGLPSEVINVVVSVIARMSFDFALWSESMVPITIVCEEAHRYIPSDSSVGFEPTKRSLAKIAKEGRKYGVSLGVISQRPSELDSTILSQCNTLFVMRMANEMDQKIVLSAISDSASSLLEFLPSLGTGECIVFGDGVTLPVRMRFNRLPPEYLPRSSTAKFTESWRKSIKDDRFLEAVVRRWRAAGTPTASERRAQALPVEEPGFSRITEVSHQVEARGEPAVMDVPAAPLSAASDTGMAMEDMSPAPIPPAKSAAPAMPEAAASPVKTEQDKIREALRSKSRFIK